MKKIRKIIPYILIIIAFVGFFGVVGKVQAADNGTCRYKIADKFHKVGDPTDPPLTQEQCGLNSNMEWVTTTGTVTDPITAYDQCIADGGTYESCKHLSGAPATNPSTAKSEFEKWATDESCGILGDSSMSGCLKAFFYYVVYTPASFLLMISAKFFNALIAVSLNSDLFRKSNFISTAWGVVRDLSNIFFILILLFIAIKIILDLGAHEAKKTIMKVIIIALLINFSMFFTQIVIDSSNILALVFYNKLEVTYKNASGQMVVRPYDGATGTGEKDISGSMYNGFDPTSKLNATFWNQAKNGQPQVPVGLMIGVILVASAIMLFATYAFFVSGIYFVARLVELFVLIIFSPFALMSFTVPKLSSTDYFGWDAWIKRLITVSFMAPIFMFFMYLIFLLLNADLFGGLVTKQGNWIQTLMSVVIPGVLILVLLLKATEFAKKGSGQFGEMIMKGVQIAGGLALGVATGGASLAATSTVGRGAQKIANNDELRAKAAAGDKGAQRKLALANSLAKSSFDIRQTGLGKFAAKKTGMDFGRGTGIIGLGTEKLKGGRHAQQEREKEKEQAKQKTYELTGDAAARQNERAAQYEKDKVYAKKRMESMGLDFDEEEFKRDYEEGTAGEKRNYGLNRTIDKGSIGTSAVVNQDRRMAYASSLQAKADKDKARGVVKTFFAEWYEGTKKMYATPVGLTQTAVAGALTGGVGLWAAPLAAGFLHALKPMFTVRSTDREVIAAVRRGEDPLKKVVADLKKIADIEGKTEPTHSTPASKGTSSTPPPSTPSTGGHSPSPH